MKKLSWFPVIHETEAQLAIIDSATAVLWRSLLVVFVTEFAVMLLLGSLEIIPFSLRTALLDGLLLSVIALPALYLVILRPVTALAAEQAAASAESRFETIARTVQDGIVVFGWERTIKFANPAIEKMFGYAPGALLGKDVEVLMPEDVAEQFREGIELYRDTGENLVIGKGPVEFAGRRKDGELFSLELSVDVVMARTQTHFVVVLRDITERKRAEATLRGSEQKLRRILEALPVAVRIVQKGKVVFANLADARLHGYGSPEEEIGADITTFVAEEERDKVLGYARAREAGGEAPRWHETRARRRDKTTVHVEVTAERILHAGAPAGLVVLRDLTEEERLHMFEQILPVCCVCGKIRDDSGAGRGKGAWGRLDDYVARHSNAQVSHGFCPECYGEYRKKEGLS
jgi:PAS domain S-box-containing protein